MRNYSWFASVAPSPNSSTRFLVSVVVCYKRIWDPAAEKAVTVSTFYDTAGSVALGGGSVLLSGPLNDANINVRENDWVALVSTGGTCRWYRVAAVGNNLSDPTQPTGLTLVGPDWQSPSPGNDKLVALGRNVVGVYTATIDLDTDPTWRN